MEYETLVHLKNNDSILLKESLKKAVLSLQKESFESLALEVFQYQARFNPVYAEYLSLLSIRPESVKVLTEIPFLPIQLFKNHKIISGQVLNDFCFESSGTTGSIPSCHYVSDLEFYNKISQIGFEKQFGPLNQYCFLALLPSYLERQHSSLVHMVAHFISQSQYKESGFFLDDQQALVNRLERCIEQKVPTILIGVSFALLDLAESYPMPLHKTVLMETGGMKGRRKEMTRSELHRQLCTAFQLEDIHSEYGMTELLSQSYSKGKGLFFPSMSKQLLLRDPTDPFQVSRTGRRGVLNIVDLGNIDSCSFIATDDLGNIYADGSFEVLGRLDDSELRGCNLLIEVV